MVTLACARLVEVLSFGESPAFGDDGSSRTRVGVLLFGRRKSKVTRRDLPLPCDVRTQMMSYYLLTVLRQDDGMEVQRIIKELIRNKVRLRGAMNRWRRPRRAGHDTRRQK